MSQDLFVNRQVASEGIKLLIPGECSRVDRGRVRVAFSSQGLGLPISFCKDNLLIFISFSADFLYSLFTFGAVPFCDALPFGIHPQEDALLDFIGQIDASDTHINN